VRRLQEYERFKKAAADIDRLPRMERDNLPASAELVERKVVKLVPQVTLQEMLLAFRDVVARSNLFAHHHVQRERLSVRQRMSDILGALKQNSWVEFGRLFNPEEGRMGVTVTFSAILELMREGLIDIVQAEVYGPLHVRPAAGRHLSVVPDEPEAGDEQSSQTADEDNIAALAQPAQPDEDDDWDPEEDAAAALAPEATVESPPQDSVTEALASATMPPANDSPPANEVPAGADEQEHSI
jgi:segregation and condensation protein A